MIPYYDNIVIVIPSSIITKEILEASSFVVQATKSQNNASWIQSWHSSVLRLTD